MHLAISGSIFVKYQVGSYIKTKTTTSAKDGCNKKEQTMAGENYQSDSIDANQLRLGERLLQPP